ncbi:hypothetical protein PPGU19_072050 (plasmid) [Paraburkholderia sp. PGU19]|nr:hypothetical protein PPGU19_072050 [Paraburkholderia sp. PGU19]
MTLDASKDDNSQTEVRDGQTKHNRRIQDCGCQRLPEEAVQRTWRHGRIGYKSLEDFESQFGAWQRIDVFP